VGFWVDLMILTESFVTKGVMVTSAVTPFLDDAGTVVILFASEIRSPCNSEGESEEYSIGIEIAGSTSLK